MRQHDSSDDEGRPGSPGRPSARVALATACLPRADGDTRGASRMHDQVEVRVRPRRVLWTVFAVCAGLEILFVVLDYFVNYRGSSSVGAIRRLTNITREDGLSGWFQPVQTLLVALTVWAIYVLERRLSPTRWQPLGWALVAAFFTYMAVDDGTKLHERVGTAFSATHGRDTLLAAFPSYAWQVVFLPAFALLGAFTLLFLWQRIPDRWGRALVVAGLGCFVVAVGLDFVEGLPREHALNVQTWLIDRLDLYAAARRHFGRSAFEVVAHFSKSLEETLEGLGTTLLWIALLRHLMHRTGEVRVGFGRVEP